MTTSMSVLGGAPVPSMTVAPRKAITAARTRPFIGRFRASTPSAHRSASVERAFLLALLFLNLDRVDAREAGGAGVLERTPESLEHPFGREVAERVGFNEVANFLDRGRGRDQLLARRRVDAVVTGV